MRRQILASVVAAHWAAVFGLLAFLSMSEPRAGIREALQFLSLGVEEGAAGGARLAAMFGLTFALAAALFLRMLAEGLFGRREAGSASIHLSCRQAVAGGAIALLLVLGLAPWTEPDGRHLLIVECALAAILLSYLSVCAEQFFGGWIEAERGKEGSAARSMALGAAHATLLSRMSGRPAGTVEERL